MKKYSKWDVFVGSFCYRVGLSKNAAMRIKINLDGCVQNVNILKHRSSDVG